MSRFVLGGTPCANCGERVRSGTIACPHCKQRAWTSNDRDDEPVTGEPDVPTLADVLAAKDAENERLREALRWLYRNGMVPHPTRPDWVSEAFSNAFADERAALSEQEGK